MRLFEQNIRLDAVHTCMLSPTGNLLKPRETIPTLYPEQFKNRYLKGKLGQILSSSNVNLFFVQTVEGICHDLTLPTAPHRNTAYECILLTKGQLKRSLGLETFEVQKNSIFFLPAGQITTIESISKDAEGFYCHFDASVLIKKYINLHLIREFDFLRVISNPVIKLPVDTISNLSRLFGRLAQLHQQQQDEDLIQSYLLTILLEIKQYHHSREKTLSPSQHLTNRFKELVAENYKTGYPVSEYARILNVSPNHLNKLIKSATGKTPSRWINEMIVLEAKVLLYQSNLSIGEISYELGIEDPSYFGRKFKKYTGVTPTAFRKKREN